MPRRFALLFLPALLLNTAPLHAQEDEAARWQSVSDLADRAVEVETYRADFTQEKITPLLRDPIESSGTIRVAGGVARWDTLEPYPSTMLISEGELRLYYPQQQTLEVYDLGERLDAMAASPIPDLELLRESFSLESVERGNEAVSMLLLPREEELQENVSEVRVTIDPSRGVLTGIEITDPDGDLTVLTFEEITLNPELSADELALEVPVGTKIVKPLEAAGG